MEQRHLRLNLVKYFEISESSFVPGAFGNSHSSEFPSKRLRFIAKLISYPVVHFIARGSFAYFCALRKNVSR
jgi:hypothetical protein